MHQSQIPCPDLARLHALHACARISPLAFGLGAPCLALAQPPGLDRCNRPDLVSMGISLQTGEAQEKHEVPGRPPGCCLTGMLFCGGCLESKKV